MRNRAQIRAEHEEVSAQTESLKLKLTDLVKEDWLLSDKEQWFTEQEETEQVSKRPKKFETALVGRVHWNEFFQDGDKPEGEGVTIERSKIVRVNGEWL